MKAFSVNGNATSARESRQRALSGVFTMEGLKARLCSFIFQRAFCNRRHLRLGDGEAGEAATQTNLYLGEQQDAGIVQMLGSKMNHHLNRQFSLFG